MQNRTCTCKWILVVGARPNFMKVAPLLRAIQAHNAKSSKRIQPFLVHSGQHYDTAMSDAFFRDLDLPEPDIHLGIGSGSQGEQTGKVLIEFEKVLMREKPDLVIVVGDVNTTLACALAAVKLHIPVAHVEAGLRSFDRKMPEEINRLLTDAISDYLFTPSPDADENLQKEGIPPEKIFLVGDIMVDSLLFHMEKAKKTDILERLGLRAQPGHSLWTEQPSEGVEETPVPYALLTLHRPSNVDSKEALTSILTGVCKVASRLPVLFPIHPRTRKQIAGFGMESHFQFHLTMQLDTTCYSDGPKLKDTIHCFDPLGYLDFLNLMANATVVLTDSGGIQEETTVLGIPCITVRDTTERPITLSNGTNTLVGTDPQKIFREVDRVLEESRRTLECPSYWDGRTADRIVSIIAEKSTVGLL